MMDEEAVSIPCGCDLKESNESVYPTYFGVSCAFVALHLLSTSKETLVDDGRWMTIADRMLQGSAQLVGLLVLKAQGGEAADRTPGLVDKVRKLENEVVELKKRRREDAKANEKVVSIFASREQSWFSERKRLRQQIQALLDGLRRLEVKKEEVILNLNGKVEEKELLIHSKDKALEEEERKRKELEEKLQTAEAIAKELKETAKKEKQDHSSELWKHKTAFIELVSNQRQLEAEIGRALRQADAAKKELDAVFEQKEESVSLVQKLSVEVVKMQKDAEQKEKILAAMLRKSKFDTTEKQMLLKELKISKARRKQAELETERWKGHCESGQDRHLRSNLANRYESRLEQRGLQSVEEGCSQNLGTELQPIGNGLKPNTILHEYLEVDHGKEIECNTVTRTNNGSADCLSQYLSEENGEHVITANAKQLEDWVRLETEKYISILEQRHSSEIGAFAEQMRLKDEKLEAFRWRWMSMELESKRLQSHIEGLEENLSHFREENIKLETVLLDREMEIKSLKENFSNHIQHSKGSNSMYFSNSPTADPTCSEVKIIKWKITDKEREQMATSQNNREQQDKYSSGTDIPRTELMSDQLKVNAATEIYSISVEEHEGSKTPIEEQSQDTNDRVQFPEEEIQEEKELGVDPGNVQENHVQFHQDANTVDKLASMDRCAVRKDSSWKMDIHALGVSYKIKRLKHQLLILEKLVAAQAVKKPASKGNAPNVPESCEKRKLDDEHGLKDFLLLMSLLNKQVRRYLSLEEKTDDLCKRMHDNNLEGNRRDSSIPGTKGQTKIQEHFLEEAFQLQRYMVATGQKLVDIQSRIASSVEGNANDLSTSAGIDMRQFADCIRTLFREVQKGLEVRISRIIGDLEGTLACEGILHLRS